MLDLSKCTKLDVIGSCAFHESRLTTLGLRIEGRTLALEVGEDCFAASGIAQLASDIPDPDGSPTPLALDLYGV